MPDRNLTDFLGDKLRADDDGTDESSFGEARSDLWKNSVAALILEARLSRKVFGAEDDPLREDEREGRLDLFHEYLFLASGL